MSRFALRHLRLVGPLVATTLLTNTSLAALAQPVPTGVDCSAFHFEIANPSPGSRLDPGDYVLQGIAQDTRAEQGPGIERIDFFIGNRDSGGVIIGRAIPGAVGMFEPFGPNSFETTITLPNVVGGRELFGYARSAVADQEVMISVPLALGVEPNRAGELMVTPGLMTCTPPAPAGPVAVEVESPAQMPEAAPEEAPAEAASEMAPVEMAPSEEESAAPEEADAQEESAAPEESAPPEEPRPLAPAARMYFDVGNPSPGDNIHVGDLLIEGMAFDRAADQGHGITRVDVFLEDRDAGGVLVGQAQLGLPSPAPEEPQLSNAGWRARVTIPSTMTGPRTMFFYALSDVTGGEMVVRIPILVVQ